jgi:hypothetical protein
LRFTGRRPGVRSRSIVFVAGHDETIDRHHWDTVWSTTAPDAVSWFQTTSEP